MYYRERIYDPETMITQYGRISREYGYRKKSNVINPEYKPPVSPPKPV